MRRRGDQFKPSAASKRGPSSASCIITTFVLLHVHPAIQVGMGDLFIRAVRADPDQVRAGKSLLIETHSEQHILLRLLRRIREMSQGELPPGVAGLKAEDLAIVYVEGDDAGVRFRPLAVDQEGKFIDRWPHGFILLRHKTSPPDSGCPQSRAEGISRLVFDRKSNMLVLYDLPQSLRNRESNGYWHRRR